MVVTVRPATSPSSVRQERRAWPSTSTVQAPQCGYCQSGQILQAAALLRDKPEPSDADIDAAMNGNLCRCMAYVRIRKAIHLAARQLREAGGHG